MAAVAVCEAIESLTDCEALIKWVNDIYVDGRKVCGILTEAHPGTEAGSLDCIVVGIGINAYAPKGGFPDDIKDRAGCVFKSQASDMRNSLAAEVLSRFMDFYRSDSHAVYLDKYRIRSLATGRDVEISGHGTLRTANVLGIDDEFGLIVRYPDGSEEVLRSGEVSIRGIED
jgi:BirA family biotin operon repressor/biotin-[acetyl-CoA-carboxylase] ligase